MTACGASHSLHRLILVLLCHSILPYRVTLAQVCSNQQQPAARPGARAPSGDSKLYPHCSLLTLAPQVRHLEVDILYMKFSLRTKTCFCFLFVVFSRGLSCCGLPEIRLAPTIEDYQQLVASMARCGLYLLSALCFPAYASLHMLVDCLSPASHLHRSYFEVSGVYCRTCFTHATTTALPSRVLY
jgi:hypothetical protein